MDKTYSVTMEKRKDDDRIDLKSKDNIHNPFGAKKSTSVRRNFDVFKLKFMFFDNLLYKFYGY